MFDLAISTSRQNDLHRVRELFGTGVVAVILRDSGAAAGVAAESVVSDYPKVTGNKLAVYYTRQRKDGSTYLSKFKSQKQQYYVVKVLGEAGKIPHRRTGTLGKSITSSVEQVNADEVLTKVGTNKRYAPFVIGLPPVQSHYHQGNWTPLETNLQRNIVKITRVFENTARRRIREYLQR